MGGVGGGGGVGVGMQSRRMCLSNANIVPKYTQEIPTIQTNDRLCLTKNNNSKNNNIQLSSKDRGGGGGGGGRMYP